MLLYNKKKLIKKLLNIFAIISFDKTVNFIAFPWAFLHKESEFNFEVHKIYVHFHYTIFYLIIFLTSSAKTQMISLAKSKSAIKMLISCEVAY